MMEILRGYSEARCILASVDVRKSEPDVEDEGLSCT